MIAKRRRVFKVEVVGDCYVAVCGLPDPRVDHAVVMCKFALECVKEMNRSKNLKWNLDPTRPSFVFAPDCVADRWLQVS